MINILKRYRTFLLLLMINALIIVFKPDIGLNSIKITWNNTLKCIDFSTIFIMLGLLDVWYKGRQWLDYGEKSGIIGIVLHFLMVRRADHCMVLSGGGVLLKKGAKIIKILIYWCLVNQKYLCYFFEASHGWKFMITRFIIDFQVNHNALS